MALLKTVEMIVGSPYRSNGWKVFDVTLLCLLWAATIVSVLIWLDGNFLTGWDVGVLTLSFITVIATARVWYRNPRWSKRARERALRSTGSHLETGD